MAISLTIQSAASGTIQTGGKTIGPFTIAGSATVDQIDVKNLASGDNTFTVPTVPSGVVGCVIEPPSSNTNVLTLKGAGADTGISISKTGPTVINFGTLPATIIINSSAGMTAGTYLAITWF